MEVYGSIVPKELCVFFLLFRCFQPQVVFWFNTLRWWFLRLWGAKFHDEGRVLLCWNSGRSSSSRLVTLLTNYSWSCQQHPMSVTTHFVPAHLHLCCLGLPWKSLFICLSCPSHAFLSLEFSHTHTDLDIAKNVPSLFASLGCGSLSRLPLQASF